MSFSRVNPGSWPVGATVTAAQLNALDSDHANALDKTIAGDTLSGVITMASTGQIIGGAANAFQSGAVGGFELTGGSTDWPTFSATRSRTAVQPARYLGAPTGWLAGTDTDINGRPISSVAFGPGTAQWASIPIDRIHNGATLATVTVWVQVVGGHSGVPLVLPQVDVITMNIAGFTPGSYNSLRSGFNGAVMFGASGSGSTAPATATAWFNGGVAQSWVFNCNQNNVINTSTNLYAIQLQDESSTNSLPGNRYYGFQLGYTTIPNMAFA